MHSLHIEYLSGKTEQVPLNKSEPVSLGTHSASDIILEGENVAPLHCRISWTNEGFEASAAGQLPIEVDGVEVTHTILKQGMLLRIGEADIRFINENELYGDESEIEAKEEEEVESAPPSSVIGLIPLTGDELPEYVDGRGQFGDSERSEKEADAKELEKSKKKQKTKTKQTNKSSRSKKKQEERNEQSMAESEDQKGNRKSRLDKEEPLDDLLQGLTDEGYDAPEEEIEEEEPTLESLEEGGFPEESESGDVGSKTSKTLARRRRSVRPGEQELIKSPLILGLIFFAVVLFLTAVTYAFLNYRDAAQKQFDAAVQLREEGSYSNAILAFNKFILDYPRHKLAEDAKVGASESEVDMYLGGSSPRLEKALTALDKYIETQRDSEKFSDRKPKFVEYASVIAQKSAKTAGSKRSHKLLEVSDLAVKIISRYQSKDEPLTEVLNGVGAAYRVSSDQIRKEETLTEALKAIDAAVDAKETQRGLKLRRDLLDRYPDFGNNRKVRQRLDALLEAEKEITVAEKVPVSELKKEEAPAKSPYFVSVFSAKTRSRSERQSNGKVVIGRAKGACFGVDAITGDALWRRELGAEETFFPVAVETSVPARIAFDSSTKDLILLNQKTGQLIWKRPLSAMPVGAPLIHQGQIYQVTEDALLWRISLETGAASSKMKFSQEISARPALSRDQKHLLLPGKEGLIYTLTLQPFECLQVTYLGHRPNSIKVGLVPKGHNFLVCENIGLSKCKLKALEGRALDKPLIVVDEKIINGSVFDPPLLRGSDLFVSARKEQIHPFSVSDEKEEEPLSRLTPYPVEGAVESKISLIAGPDKEIWVHSSAFRKFELTAKALVQKGKVTAQGLNSQPLQYSGNDVFLGRRQPFSDAVYFSHAERSSLNSQWQAVLGASAIAFKGEWGSAGAASKKALMTVVTETGDVFRIVPTEDSLHFEHKPGVHLPLPKEMINPLSATLINDGRLVVWTQEKESTLWLLNSSGQVQKTIHPLALKGEIQASPISFQKRLVIPVKGRLKMPQVGKLDYKVHDFLQPFGDKPPPAWTQLHTIDAKNILAIDVDGKVLRLQYRTAPKRQLVEVSSIDLKQGAETAWDPASKSLAVVTANQSLRVLDALALTSKWEQKMVDPVKNGPWFIGSTLIVQKKSGKVVAYDVKGNGKEKWSVSITGNVNHSPGKIEKFISIVTDRGELVLLDAQTGKLAGTQSNVPALSIEPKQHGQEIVLCTRDGRLYRIPLSKVLEKKGATK